jgi:hypothetical protein
LSNSIRNPLYLDLHAPKGPLFYRVRAWNRHGSGKWSSPVSVSV